jgi:hypothetical protein
MEKICRFVPASAIAYKFAPLVTIFVFENCGLLTAYGDPDTAVKEPLEFTP